MTKPPEIELQNTSRQNRQSLLSQTSVSSTTSKRNKKSKPYRSLKREQQDITITSQKTNNVSPSAGNTVPKQKKKFSWPIFRIFFAYTLQRKCLATIGLILSLLYAWCVSSLPLDVGRVLDYITDARQNGKQIDQLQYYIRMLATDVGLMALFAFFRFICMNFLQELLSIDMKNDIFSKFIHFDLYFFEQYKSGELVSRLSSDINQAKSAVSNNLAFFIRSMVIVLITLIILFTISWKLALLVMLIMPMYLVITFQYSKRNKVLIRKIQDITAQMSANVSQKFSGIQLVKAYSNEQQQIEIYKSINNRSYSLNKMKIFLSTLYNVITQFLPYLSIILILWYGGTLIIEGSSELSPGQLTSFIMSCSILASSSSAISNAYNNIINGIYSVEKVFEMMQYQPMIEERRGNMVQISGDIEFKNVRFQYPTSKIRVFNDLSLKIDKGEYIAFVGESGSGKSTIIKLIEGFYCLQSGSICFDDQDASTMDITYLRKQIGFVNQEATMFSGTIQDNITYGLKEYTREDLETAALNSGCMEFLKNQKNFPNGFETEVGEKGCSLSGGQKQRIAIARALIRKPKIIIFDQATSALDSNSQQMVQTSIEHLAIQKSQNRPTIIVIAHRLSTVINADRIYVMKNGQIVQNGSHKYLKALRGYYYQLVQKQLNDNPQIAMHE